MTKTVIVLLLLGAVTFSGSTFGLSIIPEPITIVEYEPSKGGSFRRVHSYPSKLPPDYLEVPEIPAYQNHHPHPIEGLINPRLGAKSEENFIRPEQTRPFTRPGLTNSAFPPYEHIEPSEYHSSFEVDPGKGQTGKLFDSEDDISVTLTKPRPQSTSSDNRPQVQTRPISGGYLPPVSTKPAHPPTVSNYASNFPPEPEIHFLPISTNYFTPISTKPRPRPSNDEESYEVPDADKEHHNYQDSEIDLSYQGSRR